MTFFDVINLVLNADACSDTGPGGQCPGSVFTAIAAAFATQGYYAQANLLDYLHDSAFSLYASFIYLLCGIAALVAYVLGAPPRNYLWFLIGPAVYGWLISQNPNDQALGVRLLAADQATADTNQKEVWRLAEVGLINSEYVRRANINIQKDAPPNQPAPVAMPFLWADLLVSDVVEQFVEMSGVYEQAGSGGGNANAPSGAVRRNWNILSDLKWSMVEDITAAKLKNGDTRDAFVTFLASECGDMFSKQIDEGKWITAASGEGEHIPNSVLKYSSIFGISATPIGVINLQTQLRRESIPIPKAFRDMVADSGTLLGGILGTNSKTFARSASFLRNEVKTYLTANGGIGGMSCDSYLWILVHAFRFEAGHIYFQLTHNGPAEFKDDPEAMVENLFYGWGISNTPDDRKNYLIDLIFIHLLRNEFAIAPEPVDVRYSASKEAQVYVDEYARTLGSKAKYGEVYSWALMMPYIQGVTLYVLAMAYPLAALMVIVPGWHKVIITWLSFWVWVKFWDVGFAVVHVIERSIWAMIGSSSNQLKVTEKILEMANRGRVDVSCGGGGGGGGTTCIIPDVTYVPAATGGLMDQQDTFWLFDRGLTLAANMDLDLTNSYYIYIMAALYFAVPAVTGQIFLGAKAGASSLVGGFISGFSDKVGSAAGSGFTSQNKQDFLGGKATADQAMQAKEWRQSGLGAQHLDAANQAALGKFDASGFGMMNTGIGGMRGAGDVIQSRAGQAFQVPGTVFSGMPQPVQERGRGDRSLGSGKTDTGSAPPVEKPTGARAGISAGAMSGPRGVITGGGNTSGNGAAGAVPGAAGHGQRGASSSGASGQSGASSTGTGTNLGMRASSGQGVVSGIGSAAGAAIAGVSSATTRSMGLGVASTTAGAVSGGSAVPGVLSAYSGSVAGSAVRGGASMSGSVSGTSSGMGAGSAVAGSVMGAAGSVAVAGSGGRQSAFSGGSSQGFSTTVGAVAGSSLAAGGGMSRGSTSHGSSLPSGSAVTGAAFAGSSSGSVVSRGGASTSGSATGSVVTGAAFAGSSTQGSSSLAGGSSISSQSFSSTGGAGSVGFSRGSSSVAAGGSGSRGPSPTAGALNPPGSSYVSSTSGPSSTFNIAGSGSSTVAGGNNPASVVASTGGAGSRTVQQGGVRTGGVPGSSPTAVASNTTPTGTPAGRSLGLNPVGKNNKGNV